MQKKLALIILNWNGADDSIECLESLKVNKSEYDIFLLDNGSDKNDCKKLERYLCESQFDIKIVLDKVFSVSDISAHELYFVKSDINRGFAQGNNFIANIICANYKYILLLNNDTLVPESSIKSMIETIECNGDVAVTCDIRYNYDRNKLWNAGGVFKWYGDRKYYSQSKIDKLISKKVKYIRAEYITGCAMLVDCNYIKEYGLFTDKFFHGEEDYNFCLNLKRRKLTAGVDLSVQIFHKVGQSIERSCENAKEMRSNIVHFSNRIIDYKYFYSKIRWKLWDAIFESCHIEEKIIRFKS